MLTRSDFHKLNVLYSVSFCYLLLCYFLTCSKEPEVTKVLLRLPKAELR